ncbi:hypothetical protein ACLMJK_001453 [Lecanora helva]
MADFNVASTAVLAILVTVLLAYISIILFFAPTYDPREPPVLPQYIPAKNSHLPIFTLQTLNRRTYIVGSPDLVSAVDRNQKTISFLPFVSALSPRLLNVPKNGHAMNIITQNITLEDGDWGLVHDTSKGMHAALAPGANLDRMNQTMLGIMEGYFDDLAKGDAVIDLYEWIRPRFSIASTEAIYGSGNPFKHQKTLGNDFWDLDTDLTKILIGVLPRYLASKGWRARERLVKALTAYFNRGDDKDGLGVLTVRRDIGKKYGATNEEISRFELGDAIGVLVNATPTLFWTLIYVYSHPSLLEEIRSEVANFMIPQSFSDGSPRHVLDITKLQDACPLLVSTYREMLRTRTRASTSRWVTEDTMLANQYLLRKDSALLVPGALIHADPIWGPDAKDFNPRRFIGKSDVKSGANRTWGGGQTLCPGRFFATTEITSSVAMMVARFDLQPMDKGGKLAVPEPNTSSVASSIHPPKNDVRVTVTERPEYKGHRWAFRYADGLN